MNSFSVIVTTYNQEYEKIRLTLDSILAQTLEDVEIVIVDDGSKKDWLKELSDYLENQGFSNYKTVKNKINVGTVKNALSGIVVATGDYAMLLSPGDLFADRKILKKMRDFLADKNACLASGVIRRYSQDNNGHFFTADYYVGDIEQFKKRPDTLLEQQLIYTRWASGGSLFFDREYFAKYLDILANKYHVRYCEDLVAPLITLNGGRMEAFEEQMIWYEWGVGISNSGGIGNVRRMYTDYKNFYEGIIHDYGNNNVVRRAYRKFNMKYTLSKCAPLYLMLRKMLGLVGRDHLYELTSFDTEQDKFLAELLGAL